MTLEQIISLTQAGFTKDDIYAMIDSNTNLPQPVVSPQPPAAAPAVPAPVYVPQQVPTQAPAAGTAPVYVPQQVPAPAPTPTQTPAPTPASAWGFAPAPVPEQTQVPQQVPQQVPAWGAQGVVQPMSENEKMMNRLMESMNSLNSTMQKSNLMADVQPKAATTEDMLAAIINPPTLKEVN